MVFRLAVCMTYAQCVLWYRIIQAEQHPPPLNPGASLKLGVGAATKKDTFIRGFVRYPKCRKSKIWYLWGEEAVSVDYYDTENHRSISADSMDFSIRLKN